MAQFSTERRSGTAWSAAGGGVYHRETCVVPNQSCKGKSGGKEEDDAVKEESPFKGRRSTLGHGDGTTRKRSHRGGELKLPHALEILKCQRW